MFKQQSNAEISAQAVTATFAAAPTTGNLLVAIHTFPSVTANMATTMANAGWTQVEFSTRSTFSSIVLWRKTSAGTETSVTAGTTGIGNVFQQLVVFEVDGTYAGVDFVKGDAGSGTATVTRTIPTLTGAGSKFSIMTVGLTGATTGWGAASSGYTNRWISPNTKINISTKSFSLDPSGDSYPSPDNHSTNYPGGATATSETATQTWTTNTVGNSSILSVFTYVAATTTAAWKFESRLAFKEQVIVDPPQVVPNLSGNTETQATNRLTALGLTTVVEPVQVFSSQPIDTVAFSTPTSGTTVPSGSTVTLTMSKGPETPPVDQKMTIPFLNKYGNFQLAKDCANTAFVTGISQSAWDQVAQDVNYIHMEGHGWKRLIESGDITSGEKFTNNRPNHHMGLYINGSYITQSGNWWGSGYWGAHAERHTPLGIAVIDTLTGMDLDVSINDTTQTLRIELPTVKPPESTHPGGTPATFWPMIASKGLTPSDTTFSRNCATYVSWVRIDDEIIGLPQYSVGDWSISAGVATITNVVRGLWGTTAASHTALTKVKTPVYIGSVELAGNPFLNSTSQLRYGLNFWNYSRGARHDGLRVICDLAAMEQQGLDTAVTATPTSVALDGRINNVAHGLQNGDRIALWGYGIPAGIRSFKPYFVVNRQPDYFYISNTSGGAPEAFTSTSISNCVYGKLSRLPSRPITTGIWWDVTGAIPYNQCDPWGNDISNGGQFSSGGQTFSSMEVYSYDYQAGANNTDGNMTWAFRQNAKRLNAQTTLTGLGFPATPFHMAANNYLDGSPRLNSVTLNAYDAYPLEYFAGDADPSGNDLNTLMQHMRGVNSSNDIVNQSGNRVLVWVKTYDLRQFWTSSTLDQYVRYGYGIWLMAWRKSATTPKLLTRCFNNKVSETPNDMDGHDIFMWDFGDPSTVQINNKPQNPATKTDLYSPTPNVYIRKYTNATIILNQSTSNYTWTLDGDYLDCLTEVNGNGVLTRKNSGSQLVVPSRDTAFLLNA